jgi:ring-1,2-phenylacetyl-CoA epoxidase subunit PaaE
MPNPLDSRRVDQLLAFATGARRVRLEDIAGQLGRDARAVFRRVVQGKSLPPVVERPKNLRNLESAVSAFAARHVRVTKVVRETADATSYYFEELDGQEMPFAAGQFMTVESYVGTERLRRAYSLAGPAIPGAPRFVTVKRIADGRVSNHLNDQVKEGQLLHVLGPSGHFTLEDAERDLAEAGLGPAKHLVLIAAGSGVTPIRSLLETALETRPELRITLLYGNRSEADVIFRERLVELAGAHADRFTALHVLERAEGNTLSATSGLLVREVIEAKLEGIDAGDAIFFVCGPAPVMDAARDALLDRGVHEARIREERFQNPERRTAADLPTDAQLVLVRTTRGEREITVEPGRTILEAGLAGGADLPFSCAMGGCGACRVRLVSGEVSMDEPNCLSSREKSEGYVLACVGRPASACVIEVA